MWGYIIAFILGIVTCKYFVPLRQKFFAFFMSKMTFDKAMQDFKGKALGRLKNVKSHFPDMAKNNSIKVLEIGVGTGTNFKYYPKGCHLTVVDPNPNFKKYYNENRSKFPQIKSEEIIVCKGEDMDMVADDSVDAVVVTWVLCSVQDTVKLLQQVKRVLVPGGKFFFFEHIREWDTEKFGKRFWAQEILTKSGIWPFLFEGCEVNRATLPLIDNAGFSKLEYEREYAPIEDMPFNIIQPHLCGVATK